MEYYGAVNDYRMYLMHYGVKGMHWGVRRYQNSDGSLTSLGRQHYGYAGENKSDKKIKYDPNRMYSNSLDKVKTGSIASAENVENGKKAFDKEKALKVLKTTAIVGGVAVGVAVVVKIAKRYDAGNIVDYYSNINDPDTVLDDFLDRAIKKTTSDTNLQKTLRNNPSKLLSQFKQLSPEDASNAAKNMRKTNFGYPVFGRTMNCTFCTAAMAMREKGYDAMARITPGGFRPTDIFDKFFEGAQTKMTNAKSFDTELAKQGPGAYGNLAVYWKDAFGGGGHSLFYKVADNGKVKIYDGQNGMSVPVSLLKTMIEDGNIFNGKGTTNYCQLNNCNPIGDIFAIVQPR